MPRKQRIENPGAVYQIISRGNFRKYWTRNRRADLFFGRSIKPYLARW